MPGRERAQSYQLNAPAVKTWRRTPLLNEGESATFTAPTQPGTYKFSCTVHAQMQGIGTLIAHD